MYNHNAFLETLLYQMPAAQATVAGSSKYPDIAGTVLFYAVPAGTLVLSEITGLPTDDSACGVNIYGYHIHSGGECTGNDTDPFANTDGHYNPHDCSHPAHAGDLAPLFGNQGLAWNAFLTNRFTPKEVVGKTVVIHLHPDDFKTQPAGDSGEKIACGVIS